MKYVDKIRLPKSNVLTAMLVLTIVGLFSFGAFYAYARNQVFVVSQPERAQAAETATTKCKGTCINLTASKAVPDTIAVPVGSYVQFNSADGQKHSLSIGEGGEAHSHTGTFSSGDFGADEAWSVQFKDEGSFIFHDHYNPKINVLVVVYTPGKNYRIQ